MKLLSYVIPAIFLGYIYFNRNPTRNIPPGDTVVSPADGTIQYIKDNRIDIFINLYDIHIQRAPFQGQITNIISKSSMYNVIELETKLGHITIERWAGELARTVTTDVKPYQYIEKGQILGRILLGSHTSITIPPFLSIKVKPYQHVLAGETVLAE